MRLLLSLRDWIKGKGKRELQEHSEGTHRGEDGDSYRYSSFERLARILASSVRMILKAELTCMFSRTARSL